MNFNKKFFQFYLFSDYLFADYPINNILYLIPPYQSLI